MIGKQGFCQGILVDDMAVTIRKAGEAGIVSTVDKFGPIESGKRELMTRDKDLKILIILAFVKGLRGMDGKKGDTRTSVLENHMRDHV